MLNLGCFPARSCGGVTRRAFLSAAGALPLAFGLPCAASLLGAASTLLTTGMRSPPTLTPASTACSCAVTGAISAQ